jgi:hypothetical protein
MSVLIHGGTAILRQSGAAVAIKTADGQIYNNSKFTSPPPALLPVTPTDWAPWGSDNCMPSKYSNYFDGTGVLSGGIDIISRIAQGQKIFAAQSAIIDGDGKEEFTPINDPEISDFLEENGYSEFTYSQISDGMKTGHTFCQLLANGGRDRINRIRRTDAATCRLGRYGNSGKIDYLYMSYNWGSHGLSFDNDKIKRVPLLDREAPALDPLINGGPGNLPREFAITSNYPLFGNKYYVAPAWWTVRQWCDIAMRVPEMKAYMFNNQMSIKYVITIEDKYWHARWQGWSSFTAEQQESHRESVMQDLDEYLSGNKNAYKSLITGTYIPNGSSEKTIPYIKIEALDDKIKDGKLLPDSAAANSEILFALILNPSLLGVDMPGGMYSGGKGGSNIREAFLAQILIREMERGFALKPLQVVARINGWKKRHPGLTFRFANQYLTTLDSGKNSKPINL